MATLYEITQDILALEKLLDETGGDVTNDKESEAVTNWLQEYDWKQKDKVDSYGAVIANYQADIKSLLEESKRLDERAKMINRRIDRMKEMLRFAMNTLGIKKMEGQKFTFSLCKNGGYAPIKLLVEQHLIPKRFFCTSEFVDMVKIREALEGNDPEALKIAQVLERGESVRIK